MLRLGKYLLGAFWAGTRHPELAISFGEKILAQMIARGVSFEEILSEDGHFRVYAGPIDGDIPNPYDADR